VELEDIVRIVTTAGLVCAHMHKREPASSKSIDNNPVGMTYLVVSRLICTNFWL
jgi:hypothetical protein